MTTDRLPPQDIEAEKAVLGAILIENNAINIVVEILKESDFYREAHKVIYSKMVDLFQRQEVIDLITLVNALKKADGLEKVGGIAYISGLLNTVATSANVKYHAEIVRDKSILRRLITISTEIAQKAYEGNIDTKEQLDQAEKNIIQITSNQTTTDYTMANDMLGDMMENLQLVASGESTASGIPTGFCDLDKMTLGLHQSDFIIIAGRPSMGKTAFSLNLVENVALQSHKLAKREKPYVVAFFSLEMSKEQLLHRMLCAEARIDSQALRTGKLTEQEWERLWGVCDTVNNSKIAIDDTPAITPLELRSKARKIKSEQGLDLIVIDYLQLMQGGGKHSNSDNRQQEVSEISRSLKALARELKVPVIALSQLSRGVEMRQVKRPMLSDLRESGSLEQDADIVAFLYRDDYYNPQTDKPNITELIIAKHRNGAVGTVELYFHKEYTRFDSFTTEF